MSIKMVIQMVAITACTIFVLNIAAANNPTVRKAVQGNVVTGIAV